MDLEQRIDAALARALSETTTDLTPPRLAEAVRHAVFPGGARLRPRLTLAVAHANGDPNPELTDAAAAAVELMHCASLVHDDLPCFDDADERRGLPTVHRVFGEPLAVLVGDGLIVAGFDAVARAALKAPGPGLALVSALARGVGLGGGIVAGQAWESEPDLPLREYRQAKTGALFEAAAAMGAISAGVDAAPWRRLGALLGEAYQIADDIADTSGSSAILGKPVNQDATLGRGNESLANGVDAATAKLRSLVDTLLEAVPPCDGRSGLQAFLGRTALRLLPAAAGLRVA
jgi:geranylgeranyl diphosphate synthase type II